MKVAIVGSRDVFVADFSKYITKEDEIVSGGATGIDTCAKEFAKANGLSVTEFLPEYARFGRAAPIVRNKKIVDFSDRVVVFWNGTSKGALSVINYAKACGKPLEVVLCKTQK